jgi:hypothetical protein
MRKPGENMMKTQFHGITSLALVGIATAIAAVAMFQSSVWMGIGYLLICGISPLIMLYAYCAKCPCQAYCGHVFPGRAAKLFKRRPGPYTTTETIALGIALLLLVGSPQWALWKNTGLLIAFWGLYGIAIIQIRSVICRACNNVYCPLRNMKQTAGS